MKEREMRVYVSSTFRDMAEERDHLVRFVFPELRKRCESRGVRWGEVDLRWGVSEVPATENNVLPLCLEEIRRSRPFFIGLLGERYGWIPDTQGVVEQAPWLGTDLDRSITELEIVHGVLNNPKMANRAFFYFRDPAYVDTLPPEQRPKFIEVSTSSACKLYSLKNRIRESGFPVRENYPSPKAMGESVFRDFMEVIDALFPEGSQPDPLDREAIDHEFYAGSRTRVYVARQEYYDRLDAYAGAGDDQPLIVFGESGVGKSALLANWILHFRQRHPDVLVIQHYVGATPYSSDWSALLRRLMGEFKRQCGLQQPIPEKPDELRSVFPHWLTMATEIGRVLLVLDGLNQLDGRDDALDLDWLPPVFPRNCAVVCATLSGQSLDALRRRACSELPVGPLTTQERKQLIVEFLAQFRKVLPDMYIEKIIAAEQSANPLFLRTMLDELRQSDTYETLGLQTSYYLEAQTLDQLYGRVLERWERDYGMDLVRQSFSLIWAAPRGLSEAELLDLLKRDKDPLPRALWAPFYLAAGEALVFACYGLAFAHKYLSVAVERLYLRSEEERRVPHRDLAFFYFSMELPTLGNNLKALRFLLFHAREADENDVWMEAMTDFGYLHAVVEQVDVTEGADANDSRIPWHAGYFVILDEIQRWLFRRPAMPEATDLIEPLNIVWERHPDFVRSPRHVMPTLYHELKALEKIPPKEVLDRIKRRIVLQHGPLATWCERERLKYDRGEQPWAEMMQLESMNRCLAFISYRREGGAETARLIYQDLHNRGIRSFLDVEDLPSGHFDKRLLREIESVPNFIVILTPGCLVRCKSEKDWLRQEIEHAIITERNIIPILKDGFEFPPAGELPPTMAELSGNNYITYNHVEFRAILNRLVSYLKK